MAKSSILRPLSPEATDWVLDYNAEGYSIPPPSPSVTAELSRYRPTSPVRAYRALHFETREDMLFGLGLAAIPSPGLEFLYRHPDSISSWGLTEARAHVYLEHGREWAVLFSAEISPKDVLYHAMRLPRRVRQDFVYTTDSDDLVVLPKEERLVSVLRVKIPKV